MKRKASALILVLLISSFLIPLVAEAQPEPPNVSTLGPAVFTFQSGSVIILSPKNSTSYVNPIQLNFTVSADGLFGQFGNVGVSIDGGVINSVTDFINKSAVPTDQQYWYRTTVLASVMLPTLSEGTHHATVYYGWQYLGNNQRYEVFAHATVQFTIDTSPPTISGLSISNKTYNLQTIPLSFNVDENTSWVAYNLDNQGNKTIQGNITLTGLSDGSHSIVIYANDTAGNMGKSNTIFFTVKTPTTEGFNPATTVLVATASGLSVAVVGLGLLVYFKKRKKSREINHAS
jgi:hypothetical protein